MKAIRKQLDDLIYNKSYLNDHSFKINALVQFSTVICRQRVRTFMIGLHLIINQEKQNTSLAATDEVSRDPKIPKFTEDQ